MLQLFYLRDRRVKLFNLSLCTRNSTVWSHSVGFGDVPTRKGNFAGATSGASSDPPTLSPLLCCCCCCAAVVVLRLSLIHI